MEQVADRTVVAASTVSKAASIGTWPATVSRVRFCVKGVYVAVGIGHKGLWAVDGDLRLIEARR